MGPPVSVPISTYDTLFLSPTPCTTSATANAAEPLPQWASSVGPYSSIPPTFTSYSSPCCRYRPPPQRGPVEEHRHLTMDTPPRCVVASLTLPGELPHCHRCSWQRSHRVGGTGKPSAVAPLLGLRAGPPPRGHGPHQASRRPALGCQAGHWLVAWAVALGRISAHYYSSLFDFLKSLFV
jgi:hypothetical protein